MRPKLRGIRVAQTTRAAGCCGPLEALRHDESLSVLDLARALARNARYRRGAIGSQRELMPSGKLVLRGTPPRTDRTGGKTRAAARPAARPRPGVSAAFFRAFSAAPSLPSPSTASGCRLPGASPDDGRSPRASP